jgi:uncharacterized protein YceK
MTAAYPSCNAVTYVWRFAATVVLLICAMLSGCSTLVPMDVTGQGSPGAVAESTLQPGDKLVVKLKTGDIVNMTLMSAQDGIVSGTSELDGAPVSIEADRIASIERREFSKSRTALVVAGVASAVLIPPILEFFRFILKGVSL